MSVGGFVADTRGSSGVCLVNWLVGIRTVNNVT